MSLQLYDSATRSLRPFVPRVPGHASIYLCGATVQGSPHIGHVRSALAFDVLRRWLDRSGYQVTFIRNVTDIDDKILSKSAQAGVDWWAWAYRFEREFTAAYDALGVLPPTYEPRATGHIGDMIALIEELIAAGHAYVGEPGNVYFSVASFPGYGALTRQGGEDNADAEPTANDKRDPRDFALWKAPRPSEPADAAWPAPFGRGRPGWHLECSAMSRRFLGRGFDIHGGGIDLRFPHHENELAQSRAAGDESAAYWLHNAWVTIAGEKMSKSLGNSLVVSNVLATHPAAAVRLALVGVHYRSTVEYSEQTLTTAATVWERLRGFVTRTAEVTPAVGGDIVDVELPTDFVAALDDDLNVSAGLAVVHEQVRLGNAALAAGQVDAAAAAGRAVRAMLDVLGLDPLSPHWRGAGAESGQEAATSHALGVLVEEALTRRQAARAAKDWASADAVRDALAAAGIVVEDGPEGARWRVEGQ